VKIDRRLLALLALVGALGLLAAYGLPLFRDSEPGAIDPVAFQKTMRELWTDHMQWTFLTVNAFFHNPGAVQAYLNRLLQNQQEIGAAFVPFYGQETGQRLAGLLTTHIQQAVPVLQAAQADLLSAGIIAQFPERFVR